MQPLVDIFELDKELRKECYALFPKNKVFDYGTAGFRSLGDAVKFVCFTHFYIYVLRLDLDVPQEQDYWQNNFTHKQWVLQ